MEIVLDFGPTVERIEVALPDDGRFHDALETLKHAWAEGIRHVVSVTLRTQAAARGQAAALTPMHGVIVFESTRDYLNCDFEGAWWFYVRHSRSLRACAISLEMICEVIHVKLTVDDD